MDISEFEKRAKPRNRRSRLDPFLNEIFELHSKGFTLAQITEFLGENGVKVSGEAVRQFIDRRSSPVRVPLPSVAPSAEPVAKQQATAPREAPRKQETAGEVPKTQKRLNTPGDVHRAIQHRKPTNLSDYEEDQ